MNKRLLRRAIAINGLVAALLLTLSGCPNDIVVFKDQALESAVRDALGQPFGALRANDLATITELNAGGLKISDLRGLEYCVNLTKLSLRDNAIESISPLAGLVSLGYLDLFNNKVRDIEPLSGLVFLTYLDLSGETNDIAKWDALVANALSGGLGSNATVIVPSEHVLDAEGQVLPQFQEALTVLQARGVEVLAATSSSSQTTL